MRWNVKLAELTRAGWILVGLSSLVSLAGILVEMWYVFPEMHSRPGKKVPILGMATGVLVYVLGRVVLRRLSIAVERERPLPPRSESTQAERRTPE
jgi:hypothetical protein